MVLATKLLILPLMAFTGIVPSQAATRHPRCDNKLDVKSRNSDSPATMVFVNRTKGPMLTYWIDFAGDPVLYSQIETNERVTQPTYRTHPWIVIDEKLRCHGPFMPTAAKRVIRLP